MVLSGGGARGAYEFGALEVLAPVLDKPARMIVGTSAGALGAAYLAANAHDGLEAAAHSAARSGSKSRLATSSVRCARRASSAGCCSTGLSCWASARPPHRACSTPSPQPETIAALIDFEQLARDVEDGTLVTAAVVATAYATARSVVFHSGGESPPTDDRRGIDYVGDQARGRARPSLERDPVAVPGRARR